MENYYAFSFFILLDHISVEDEDGPSKPPSTFSYGNITEGLDHGLGNQESMGSNPSFATSKSNGLEQLTCSLEPQFSHL